MMNQNKPNPYSGGNDRRKIRTGMSDTAWEWAISAIEFFADVTKLILMISGIVSANLADVVFVVLQGHGICTSVCPRDVGLGHGHP